MQQSMEALPALLSLCGADGGGSTGSTTDGNTSCADTKTDGGSSTGSTTDGNTSCAGTKTDGGGSSSGGGEASATGTSSAPPPPPPPPPLQDPELAVSAFRLALTLAQESSMRPTLGQLGFLQLLWRGIHGPAAGEAAGAALRESSGETSESQSGTDETPRRPSEAGGRLGTAAGENEGKTEARGVSDSDSTAAESGPPQRDGVRPRQGVGRPPRDGAETEESDTVSVTSVTSSVGRWRLTAREAE